MRNPIKRLFTAIMVLTIASCSMDDSEILPPSTGNAGDMVVVMDSAYWAGKSGEAIMRCFASAQEGLPQAEPKFNVVKVRTEDFKRIFKTTRNIILVDIEGRFVPSKYSLKNNAWAKNQLVLSLLAKDDVSAAGILQKNCNNLVDRFRQEEYKRLISAFRRLSDASLVNQVAEVVGGKFSIPNDYKLARKDRDRIWLRKDFDHKGHQVSMGIIFYSIPYTSETQLSVDSLVANRNALTKMVEGPEAGSYMKVYEELIPPSREFTWQKNYVRELRGLWNMEGAFMGGPFVHYAFVDAKSGNLICVDGYVFAPKFDKREFLRELEAIALSGIEPAKQE